ncbi:hypothetical protein ACHQM5_010489 [Ranunculus cassubicifolius]
MSQMQEGNAPSYPTYKGIRQRKWGKWVSEIRVPNTQERLWLGSYNTPEAAAIAHDTALFCLRGASVMNKLNFPSYLPQSLHTNLSPKSIQKAASDAGNVVDAEFAGGSNVASETAHRRGDQSHGDNLYWDDEHKLYRGVEGEELSISVDDMEIYL